MTTRPAIYQDLQRLLQMHETFKERLQVVSPLSVESPPAEASTLHILQEKLRDLPRFKKSPSQSLRTRNFKATIDSRLKRAIAEPSEALKVAQELEKLVRESKKIDEIVSDHICSPNTLGHMKTSAVNTTCSTKTWTFYANQSPPVGFGFMGLKP
jgi:hypothetical protein